MNNNKKVTFSPEQLALLKKLFPKLTITPESKIEDIMYDAGKQSVLEAVNKLTVKEELFYG